MIRPANLSWREGRPYSLDFQDIYHAADAAGEVQRVFLQPADFSGLLQRPRLLVGELGFGTGLNFVVAAGRCLAKRTPLHFVSFEAAPIEPLMFAALCRERAANLPLYSELAIQYPPLLAGWHQRRLGDGLITLSVFFGDVRDGLEQIRAQQKNPFDLWLLDGFAPDRNPEMWSSELFATLAALSTRHTAVTTFTAAGRVRRGLEAQGFAMRRVDQRPFKRESLAGSFEPDGRARRPAPGTVNIIGAGIAGATLASALARSGVSTRVFEATRTPASGASSVPITVMHPRLLANDSGAAALRAHAYAHARASCASFINTAIHSATDPASDTATDPAMATADSAIVNTGALQTPSPNYPVERLAAVAERYTATGLGVEFKDPASAGHMTGIPFETPALWFPDACTLATPAFCTMLLDHPGIELITASAQHDWLPGTTVLACGNAVRQFPGAAYLELAEVWGQLDLLKATGAPFTALKLPIVGNGYLAPHPAQSGVLGAGATYEYQPWPADAATAANLARAAALDPVGCLPDGSLASTGALAFASAGAVKAARCVSSDRTAVAGRLVRHSGESEPDRYVNTGHGSMGTVTSHYCAALISAAIFGDFAPITPALEKLLSPRRFRDRQARRGYRFGASA